MEYKMEWSSGAVGDLERLDRAVARRILKKLDWFLRQRDPLAFARRLEQPQTGDARFRIGDYRIIVKTHRAQQVLIVVAVGHRREIYR